MQAELVKDEIGSWVNIAQQELIASGRQLLALHHQRKEQGGGAAKPRRLADVYGSRWLTAGMGSVLLLWGEPGDLVVELLHLKQPVEDVGHCASSTTTTPTTLEEPVDLLIEIRRTGSTTVNDAASKLFGTAQPSRNEIEKARRRLEALRRKGELRRADDEHGIAHYHDALAEAVTPVTPP